MIPCIVAALIWMPCGAPHETSHAASVQTVHHRAMVPVPRPAPSFLRPAPPQVEPPASFDERFAPPGGWPPPIDLTIQPKGVTMFASVKDYFAGFSALELAGMALFAFVVYKHGLPWVVDKIKSIGSTALADFNKVKAVFQADIAGVKTRVDALEADFGIVKAKVAAVTSPPAAPPA